MDATLTTSTPIPSVASRRAASSELATVPPVARIATSAPGRSTTAFPSRNR